VLWAELISVLGWYRNDLLIVLAFDSGDSSMNITFRCILAAIACPSSGNTVFAYALSLAQQSHSRLVLTHCTSLKTLKHMGTFIDAGFGLASPNKLRKLEYEHYDEMEQVDAWLQDYALIARSHGVHTEVIHQVGDTSEWIRHLAQHCQADLIVIGQSRKSRFRQKLLGSKTQQIVMNAPCSVVVARSKDAHGSLLETPKKLVDTSHSFNSAAQSHWNFSIPTG
jgi:nucleotide-binding universal stress UspA family protein